MKKRKIETLIAGAILLGSATLFGVTSYQEVKKSISKIPELIKKLKPIKEDYDTLDFSQDSEKVLLARMLLGEVENCSKQERIAVAYTAINRINDNKKWNGETLKEVILKPYQYSCFNETFNKKLKTPLNYNKKEFLSCLKLSGEILSGKYKDPTNGATHYYNPRTIKEPFWAKKTKKIGKIKNSKHLFYKEL